jgi:hypothetical protein
MSDHLVEVLGRLGVRDDVRHAQVEQLRARVAEQLCRVGVDRDVAHLLVGDEDRDRAGIHGLAE